MKDEIKVGLVCNNNCVFCLNDRRDVERSTSQIKEEIDRLRLLGYDEVQFTGGEPTIRKDFFEIMQYAKDAGLAIGLQTNGRTLSYPEFADRVARLGLLFCLVSLHAHNEELNVQITRAKGGYRQAVEGIINLISRNQSVILNTVINKQNVRFLEDIALHHSRFNAATIQFSWCRPEGKVQGDEKNIIPKYSENIKYLVAALERIKDTKSRVSVHGVPHCILGDLSRYVSNPYKDVYLATQDMKTAEEWVRDNKKFYAPQCELCRVKGKCGGIFKGYAEAYGTGEFRTIR